MQGSSAKTGNSATSKSQRLLVVTHVATLLLLGLLASAPLEKWVSFKSPEATRGGMRLTQFGSLSGNSIFDMQESSVMHTWQGLTLLTISLVVAVGVSALHIFRRHESGERSLLLGSCLPAGWGCVAILWTVGFIWKIHTVDAMSEGMAPSFALWRTLATGLALVPVASLPLLKARKTGYMLTAMGIGSLVGAMLILLDVQPWSPRL